MSTPKSMLFAPALVAVFLATALPAMVACSRTPTREAAGEYLDDATITTRVKAALVEDPQVKAAEVNVETYRGVVQLSGFVNSEDEARKAVELAKKVPGVRSVKNDMHTKPEK